MKEPVARRRWAIAEGYVPGWGNGPEPRFTSLETAYLLDASDEDDAHVGITAFFADREPAGAYHLRVPARSTLHARFNEPDDPESNPADTDYASNIESDLTIAVQHTRLDSRQAECALINPIAYASND